MSEDTEDTDEPQISTSRGPAYPYTNLERAIEKAAIIADKGAARQVMPPEAFYKLWGMGAKSSSSRQTMAALNHYGLVNYVGRGKDRKVQLSDLALRIVLDKQPTSAKRDAAIRAAAIEPAIFGDLHDKYAPFLPDDVVIETFLKLDREFSDDAAKTTIRHFRDTMAFAGLDEPGSEPDDTVDKADEKADKGGDANGGRPFKVGDRVQVTVGGTDMYADGAKILGFTDDRQWAFIDQSDSAAKIEELTLMEAAVDRPPDGERPSIPQNLLKPKDDPPQAGMRKAMFPLDEGDVTLIFPEGISADGLGDLADYLEIFLKKERRNREQSN